MHKVCESCANDIGEGRNFMKCGGFCFATFCVKCCDLHDELAAAVMKKSNLFWMCNTCKNIMDKARFKNALVSVEQANQQLIEELKDQIRKDILEDIKLEIRTNFKTLIDSVPKTPLPQTPGSFSFNSAKRRRGYEENMDTAVIRPSKLLRGTDATAPTAMPTTSNHTEEKFWLYLSGISPDVADQTVTNLTTEKLGTDNVAVVKLIPRGRDPRLLNFISYKIGLPIDLKAKAMSPDTWPVGIVFREFEDKSVSKRVFWKPPTALPTLTVAGPSQTSNVSANTQPTA
ncbi:uncharacterized protein LOC128735976 [Sabethes cyaneus]|uniref:uncharacterized protein LOC128735976 n=1 Tax=Sabethes cyaneus TaxID=53552 RepID=UPI00237E985E|nr:uncharacterized protein LOC128735976 [Sabethes cyaneus]